MTTGQHAARLLMIAVLATCAGVWWWTHDRDPPPAPAAPAVGERAEPAETAGVASSIEPAPRTAPQPLPPRDAPIASIALTLQQRADGGDSLAACRLGIELLRCRQVVHHERSRPFLVERLERAEKDGEAAYAQTLRGRDADYTRLAQSCTELPAGLRDRGGAYLRQAARAGEPEAMLRYAHGQAFDPKDGYQYLASPDFDHWRREAPAMLQQALAMGRPEAVHLLHAAHASDEGMLQALVPNDPVSARTYAMLATRLQGAGGPRLGGRLEVVKLTPEQFRHASERSGEWHQRYFGGRRIDGAHALDGIAPLYDPLGISGVKGELAAFCHRAGEPAND